MRHVAMTSLILGLALVASGRADEPAVPDDRLGVRVNPLLLMGRADVQAELKLDAGQVRDLRRAIASFRDRALSLKGKDGADRVEARGALLEEERRWLAEHLTAPQRDRLRQLDLQWEGPAALCSRRAVADSLALDDKQRQALGRAVASRDSARRKGQGVAEAERLLANQALSVLTDEQQARWFHLLGEPFTPRLAAATATLRR